MRLLSLAALFAGLGAAVAEVAGGLVEFDLVYPRHGESYAPTPYMPIVFAIQNPQRAMNIYPYIEFEVDTNSKAEKTSSHYNLSQELNWVDVHGNDTYFVYTFVKDFAVAGSWMLWWDMFWTGCARGSDGKFTGGTRTNITHTTSLTIKTAAGGQPIDLLAANRQECGLSSSFVVEGIDAELLPVDPAAASSMSGITTCNMVAPARGPGEGYPASKFCDVKFDDKIAAKVEADLAKLCEGVEGGCPIATGAAASAKPSASGSKTSTAGQAAATGTASGSTTQQTGAGAAETSKSAAQRVTVVGAVGWAVGLGVIGAMLA